MSSTSFEIRSSAYYDSVILMQLQRSLASLPGVQDAGVVMATPTNLDLLAESELLPDAARGAGPDDLLIVVRAADEGAAAGAIAQVDELLSRRRGAVEAEFRPRSLASAAGMLPQAGWVLVSIPGRYAAEVASQALDLNRNVFLYSDNVSIGDEVRLKRSARSKGLLLMGPDCGTAIVNGVGLGFANRVRRGAIGLIGASGTGLQAVTVHVHALGGGISHAIGTGGRDLKDAIGGITALQALDLLERDPESRVIVIISKPPEATTAARLLAAAQNLGKPVVICFSGYPPPATRLGNVRFAVNLREAAELAVSLLDEPTVPVPGRYRGLIAYKGAGRSSLLESSDLSPQGPPRPGISGYVRGLFAGGTLASETLIGLHAVLSPLYSNMTSQYAQPLQDPTHSQFHTILDLGGDEFTVGRLHPMIDNDLRLRRLSLEAEDPEVGLICLDVVLGHGAHPDPASELAPAILEIRRKRAIEIVVILIGTEEDPQDAGAQESRLFQSGATIFRSSAEGVAYISARLGAPAPRDFPQVPLDTLETPLAAINVGLEAFYTSLRDQGAEAVQVEWRPPAGGKEDLMAILAKLKD